MLKKLKYAKLSEKENLKDILSYLKSNQQKFNRIQIKKKEKTMKVKKIQTIKVKNKKI